MVSVAPYLFLLVELNTNNVITFVEARSTDLKNATELAVQRPVMVDSYREIVQDIPWGDNQFTFVFEDYDGEWVPLSQMPALGYSGKGKIEVGEYLLVYAHQTRDGVRVEVESAYDRADAQRRAFANKWIGPHAATDGSLHLFEHVDNDGPPEWRPETFDSEPLQQYPDGSELHFVSGNFDDYCVEVRTPSLHGPMFCDRPTDSDTLYELQRYPIADHPRVFQAVVDLANQIGPGTENLSQIKAPNINGTSEEQRLFDIIAACMIAEEQRKTSCPWLLGKKLKILAAHQVLNTGMNPTDAAKFSHGKDLHFLTQLCSTIGV